MRSIQEQNDVEVLENVGQGFASKVILYDDQHHSIDEVILQLQKATSKNVDECKNITMEIHNSGKAVAYDGEMPDCIRVSGILEEIALVTEIEVGDSEE